MWTKLYNGYVYGQLFSAGLKGLVCLNHAVKTDATSKALVRHLSTFYTTLNQHLSLKRLRITSLKRLWSKLEGMSKKEILLTWQTKVAFWKRKLNASLTCFIPHKNDLWNDTMIEEFFFCYESPCSNRRYSL